MNARKRHMEMLIKRVQPSDITRILPMVKSFYDESIRDMGLPFDGVSVNKSAHLLASQHLALYAETHEGEVIGVIAGMVLPWPMDHSFIVFQEILWYVEKKYAAFGVGQKLLEATKDYCKQCGIKLIVMGALGNRNPEKMDNYFTKRGYKLMETHYMIEV